MRHPVKCLCDLKSLEVKRYGNCTLRGHTKTYKRTCATLLIIEGKCYPLRGIQAVRATNFSNCGNLALALRVTPLQGFLLFTLQRVHWAKGWGLAVELHWKKLLKVPSRGSVWEASGFAATRNLDNITLIVDANTFGQSVPSQQKAPNPNFRVPRFVFGSFFQRYL
ncbi:hypothetical protein Pelo_13318 [Pelomyxa schiedti]|nr:hypothetical protein Pelo_13318 [Pelomyxa schiedti]